MWNKYHRDPTYQTQDSYAEFNNISIENDFEEFALEKKILTN